MISFSPYQQNSVSQDSEGTSLIVSFDYHSFDKFDIAVMIAKSIMRGTEYA